MLSLIKSRVMIKDVLQNCKMMIIAQVFRYQNTKHPAARFEKKKKKMSKIKRQKRKNEKKKE